MKQTDFICQCVCSLITHGGQTRHGKKVGHATRSLLLFSCHVVTSCVRHQGTQALPNVVFLLNRQRQEPALIVLYMFNTPI